MKQNKVMLVVGLIVLFSMILAACQPVVTTVTVEVTKVVTQKETQIVNQVQTQVVVQEKTSIVTVDRKPFTTPHPILGNVKVRQAIEYCTDKAALIKAVYPLLDAAAQKKLILNSFIDSAHWAYAGDANLTIYPFQKDVGASMLQDAGWKLDEASGFRANAAGDPLSLKFTTTNAAFRATWSAVFEQQMKACGIQIVRFLVPSSWWFGATTGLARRDFELGAYAWVGQADPGGISLYACDQIPLPSNGWAGQNTMGWCNEKASTAIKKANNTLIQKDRVAQYQIVQQEFTKDVPSIPLFNRTDTYAYNPKLVGFKQSIGNQYYTFNMAEWEIPGKDTLVIGYTQEPASLYGLVEQGASVQAVLAISDGLPATSLNNTWAPLYYYKTFPTIENSGSTNNDVDVKEGDSFIDADGNLTVLKDGVKYNDNTGTTQTYKAGTTAKMKQLVMNFKLDSGIKWSDGKPLVKADMDFWWKVRCDKDSGAITYTICDWTAKVDVKSDTEYTWTYKPGVQDPFYYVPPMGWMPAHQVIQTAGAYKGKTMAEVPPKDLASLAELAQNPMGTGPYMQKEWKKNQSLTYVPNPNWYGTPVKTKNIVFKIIEAANAEPQLIAGEVDLLDSTTLAGVTDTLNKAATAGKVKVDVLPSATWEHIDFQLFVK